MWCLEMGEYFRFDFETESKAGFGLGFVAESKGPILQWFLDSVHIKFMVSHISRCPYASLKKFKLKKSRKSRALIKPNFIFYVGHNKIMKELD